MILYHSTTNKKAKLYSQTGYIRKPVRGFDNLQAAMAWSLKIDGSRKVFYRIDTDEITGSDNVHKLPDHHNQFGSAWWIDDNVPYEKISCEFSA